LTTTAEPGAAGRGRRVLGAAVGVVLSIALLAWAMRGVSLSEVGAHLAQARLVPLAFAVVVASSTFALRVVRWRFLLRTEAGEPVSWRALWHGITIGFMANNVLPLRAGELVRCYAVSRLDRVRVASAVSSVGVERALDGLTVVGLLVIALFQAGLPRDIAVGGVRLEDVATRAGVLCLLLLAGGLFVVLFPLVSERLVRGALPFPRLADRIVGIIEGLRQGLGALRSPGRLAGAVLWSVIHWTVNAWGFYLAFAAFDIQVGFAGAVLLQSLLVFGVAVPQAPGYFGVFELVAVKALGLFGVPAGVAIAYGASFHITTFVPITLLGLWSLARTGLHLRDAAAVRS
jgi:glycosyltransferase 2 family protein